MASSSIGSSGRQASCADVSQKRQPYQNRVNTAFRGFLLKRLVGKFGFTIGNITQSLLFGLIHGIAFSSAAGPQAATGLVILTASIGYAMGYINERKAGGSILPSWCIHAAANVLAGLLCAL